MQPSTRALLLLLLCCSARPASSLSESWPWNRASPDTPKSTPSWAPVKLAEPRASDPVEQAPAAQAPAEQAPKKELTRAQRAVQQASEQTHAAEAEKGWLRELEVEVEAQQRELDELDAKRAKGESIGAEGESAAESEEKNATHAEAEAFGKEGLQDLHSQLDAELENLKFRQKKRTMEAQLLAKQRGLKEASEAQQAKAKAAAEAVRAAEALKAEEAARAQRHMIKELAKQPGCYMRIPSGCPNKPMRTQKWRKDTWAEKRGVDKQGCQQRKENWDTYCGSVDAEMIFVEAVDGGSS